MNQTFFTLIRRNTLAIFLVTLASLVISVSLTLIQPLEYRSSFSVLVIEKSGQLDGYAAAKSAERLSLSLGRVIGTADFANRVFEQLQNADVPKTSPFFSTDEQVRREAWNKQVETRTAADVGLLKVSVYQENRQEAQAIANTLSTVLVGYGAEYLGGGKNVEFRVVDAPLASKHPVRPNIAANVAAGILLGLGASLGYFFLRSLSQPKSYAPMSGYQFVPPMIAPVAAAQPVAATATPHIVSPGRHDEHELDLNSFLAAQQAQDMPSQLPWAEPAYAMAESYDEEELNNAQSFTPGSLPFVAMPDMPQ